MENNPRYSNNNNNNYDNTGPSLENSSFLTPELPKEEVTAILKTLDDHRNEFYSIRNDILKNPHGSSAYQELSRVMEEGLRCVCKLNKRFSSHTVKVPSEIIKSCLDLMLSLAQTEIIDAGGEQNLAKARRDTPGIETFHNYSEVTCGCFRHLTTIWSIKVNNPNISADGEYMRLTELYSASVKLDKYEDPKDYDGITPYSYKDASGKIIRGYRPSGTKIQTISAFLGMTKISSFIVNDLIAPFHGDELRADPRTRRR